MTKVNYQVIVGNVGTVYVGNSKKEALGHYWAYVDQSNSNYSRATGECVTLMVNDDIVKQHIGVNAN